MGDRRQLRTFALAALAALAWTPEARAYEDAVEIAASVGYASRLGGGGDLELGRHGLGFAGTVGFGLDDAWSLRVTGLGHLHFPEPRFRRSALLFEVTYALDVVRVVPVVGVGAGGGLEGANGARAFAPAVSVFASLDVLVTRRFLVGPEVRVVALPFVGLEDAGDVSLSAGVRVAYLWDRF